VHIPLIARFRRGEDESRAIDRQFALNRTRFAHSAEEELPFDPDNSMRNSCVRTRVFSGHRDLFGGAPVYDFDVDVDVDADAF
jgi:hypothetical protein